MKYNVQGKIYEINTIVFDLNGVLSVRGKIVKGVKERIKKLKKMGFNMHIFTGNQRGTANKISKELGIPFIVTKNSKEKKKELKKLNKKKCAVIGNSRIDSGMLKIARISIMTLQAEGIHVGALKNADILSPSINDAIDMFIEKNILISTLKE